MQVSPGFLFTHSPTTSKIRNTLDNRVQQPHQNTQWEEVIGRESRKSLYLSGEMIMKHGLITASRDKHSFNLAGIICTSPTGPGKRHLRCSHVEAQLFYLLAFLSQDNQDTFITPVRIMQLFSAVEPTLCCFLAYPESSVCFRGNYGAPGLRFDGKRAPDELCCRQECRIKVHKGERQNPANRCGFGHGYGFAHLWAIISLPCQLYLTI